MIQIILILSLSLGNEIIDRARELCIDGSYKEGIEVLNQGLSKASKQDSFDILLEIGDIYLDKLRDFPKAESIYKSLTKLYKKSKLLGDIYYRLGLVKEKEENWIDAANYYQTVVIKFPQSSYAQDASSRIEGCFKKNYYKKAALVDSFPITYLELEERLSKLPEKDRTEKKKREILHDMIKQRLLEREAIKKGLDKDPSVLKELSRARRRMLLRELYKREITDKIKITDKEVKRYYKTHKKDFLIPKRVRARELVVKSKEEADSLLELLKKGADFDSLARTRSVAWTKTRGGDMGFFPKGRHPGIIDSVAFSLKPGEISGVIKTDTLYTILKIEEVKPSRQRKFEEVKGEIRGRLRREQQKEIYDNYINSLKRAAKIDTFPLTKDTLAIVNNHPITKEEFEARIEEIPPFARGGLQTEEGKRRFLDNLILERLLLKDAERLKLWLEDSIQTDLEGVRSRALKRALERKEVTEKIEVKEEEIENYYKTHKTEFFVPEQVEAREIVVESKEEADSIRSLLLKGADFDSLARKVSIAPDKYRGGSMGVFKRGEKEKAIEEIAFKLKPKQISEPVKVEKGYAILQVKRHIEPYIKTLKEAKGEIERRLRIEKRKELEKALEDRLFSTAKIEIFLE